VTQVGDKWFEIETSDKATELHNGDGLCYYDLQKELVGVHINRAECVSAKRHLARLPQERDCRVQGPAQGPGNQPQPRHGLGAHAGEEVQRAPHRPVGRVQGNRRCGFALTLTDEDGFVGAAAIAQATRRHRRRQGRSHAARAAGPLWRDGFRGQRHFAEPEPALVRARLGAQPAAPRCRGRLEQARADGFVRLPRAKPVEPPVPFPEDTLTYLANVYNQKAHDFYVKHGVKVIDAAYESKEEEGEVSLMITKHCVRFSMSLCPSRPRA
jgi:putative protease